jgi:Ca2+-binding EF-hand superfamily protein
MDTNDDGYLDRKEINIGYKVFFGENLNKIEIDDILESADKNGNHIFIM